MKVIKRYDDKEVTCSSCLSVLEIEARDIMPDNTGTLSNGDCYCICSVCKHTIPLNSKTFTEHWNRIIFNS